MSQAGVSERVSKRRGGGPGGGAGRAGRAGKVCEEERRLLERLAAEFETRPIH